MHDPRYSNFWQQRYERGKPGWDKGESAPPLLGAFASRPPDSAGKVLVPGCGFGHEAMHLARLGFEVVAVDFASAPIADLRMRAVGLSLLALQCDIFTLPEEYIGYFDLVVEHTCFCAIPLERRGEYAKTMAGLLGDGGQLLGLFWELEGEDGPPFNTSPQDLHDNFDPFFIFDTIEKPDNSFPGRQDEEWLVRMTRR